MPFRDISDILTLEGTLFENYNSQGYDQTLASLRIAEEQINARILRLGSDDTWTKRKLNEIKKLIEDEISKSYGGLFASIQSESVAAAGVVAGALSGNSLMKIPTQTINDIISSNREIQFGMKDNKVPQLYGFKEIFDLQEDSHERAMKRVISAGVAQGLTSKTIVKNMGVTNRIEAKKLQGSVFTVIADSRTYGNATAFKELERLGVVSYYEHVSTLDSDTSDICRPRDGRKYYQEWDDILFSNKPPLHKSCRSRLSVRTNKDLSDVRPSQFNEIPDIRYSEWFKEQPDWVKLKVLGKKRFDLYKRGQYEVKSLPDIGNKPLNLDTIKSSLDRYSRGD